jgi:hypothetical protein
MDRRQIEKILSIAISPGAYEDEAIAALLKAREVVKKNPSLAHPAPPSTLPPPIVPAPDHSIQFRATQIAPSWFPIFIGNLSEQAYGLGLKSKLSCDFSVTPTALDIRCDGPKDACEMFETHLKWLIAYVNAQQARD